MTYFTADVHFSSFPRPYNEFFLEVKATSKSEALARLNLLAKDLAEQSAFELSPLEEVE